MVTKLLLQPVKPSCFIPCRYPRIRYVHYQLDQQVLNYVRRQYKLRSTTKLITVSGIQNLTMEEHILLGGSASCDASMKMVISTIWSMSDLSVGLPDTDNSWQIRREERLVETEVGLEKIIKTTRRKRRRSPSGIRMEDRP